MLKVLTTVLLAWPGASPSFQMLIHLSEYLASADMPLLWTLTEVR